MSGTVYSSDLAVSALGLPLDGAPWRGEATRCACCGKPVLPGDIAVRDKDRFGQQFTDGPSLACRGSGAVCGACSAVMNAQPLRALQHCVVTREAAYPIRKDIHRAWFLLTPPEPPYVVVVSDTKQAHLVWKTPPTLDNRLVVVRLGARLLRIRRPLLTQAIDDCQLLADAINAARASEKKGKEVDGLRHPFAWLGREFDDPRQGALRAEVGKIVKAGSPEADAVERLRALGLGELWALATLVKRKVEAPEKPDPIRLNEVETSDELEAA